MANGAYQFSQPASAPLAAGGLGRLGQQNGFPPQFAQQLQNHLILQQNGAFPFLPPGAALAQFWGFAPSCMHMSVTGHVHAVSKCPLVCSCWIVCHS